MNERPNDLIMNLNGLRKAQGFASKTFNPCTEIKILSLNRLGVAFSHEVLVGWQSSLIGLPSIGAIEPNVEGLK